MKNFIRKTTAIFIATMFLFTIGCKKDKQENPPELPPESSFVMDFSDFQDNEEKSFDIFNDYSHYQRAVAHVVVWNLVISIHLAVPVATFTNSFNYTPVYQPDTESWKWTYDVAVNNATYTANLYGKIFDTYVRWDMYVSKTGIGSFTDFHWYFGESNLNNTGGEWTLHKNPTEPTPFVGIVWNRNIEEQVFDITYTNIVPGGPENGGYISYGVTNDEDYNAFYNIYNKGQDNLVEIKWNRTSKDGRIKDPAFFGDSDFYCWDSTFLNADCD